MFIVHGAYHWWPKNVGFRNDYCLSCAAERRSVQIRTFDVGHIFWIPFLPVGFWKRWLCTVCKRNPHQNPKTSRTLMWLGVIFVGIFGLASWAEPVAPDAATASWLFRLGMPLAALLGLIYLLRSPKDASLKEKLATVQPAADTTCPFCNTPMIGGTRWSCPACHAVRY